MGDGALVSMTPIPNSLAVTKKDTITFGGGGANADSTGFEAVTNSTAFGGGGKDTINIGLLTNSTIQASDGHSDHHYGRKRHLLPLSLLLVRVTTQSSLVLLVSQLSWVVLETTPLTLLITTTVA